MYVADGDGTSLAQKKSSEKDPACLDGMDQKRKFARQTSLPIRSSALFCMLTIYFLFSLSQIIHPAESATQPTRRGEEKAERPTIQPHPTLLCIRGGRGRGGISLSGPSVKSFHLRFSLLFCAIAEGGEKENRKRRGMDIPSSSSSSRC